MGLLEVYSLLTLGLLYSLHPCFRSCLLDPQMWDDCTHYISEGELRTCRHPKPFAWVISVTSSAAHNSLQTVLSLFPTSRCCENKCGWYLKALSSVLGTQFLPGSPNFDAHQKTPQLVLGTSLTPMCSIPRTESFPAAVNSWVTSPAPLPFHIPSTPWVANFLN